ncbi:MAG: hypothetical protein DWQ47_08415 [Acidobacteria bacterium]|nr:MAG: hypothetical protein DWQ32_16515 [Acidobacteriota bacterium]REJ99067.1 MAG: hypothetical protein DWQ38_13465 [Acidobacteriota bacterium]REK16213.1 MAG: hypothetical protein DWQ43_04225 [Acidobacteriota bacterium]REK43894.1 MAG: hypothetical protein DWQ47_08415 [Acidobacteriota bacterium]
MKKIDLMIVGAQKAATTSLKNYLGEHPEITTHPQIEFDYFVRTKAFEAGYEEAFHKHFGDPALISPEGRLIAKNANMCTHRRAFERLKEHNPECLVVYLLRNPVDRAYSSYSMQKLYKERPPFPTVIDAIRSDDRDSYMYRQFVRLGLYSEFLKRMYEYFPKDSVIVHLFEDFKNDPSKLCNKIFEKLDVDPNFRPDLEKRHNQTRKARSRVFSTMLRSLRRQDNPLKNAAKAVLPPRLFGKIAVGLTEMNKSSKKVEPLDPETRKALAEFFVPFNEELEQLTGIDTGIWRKTRKN